MRIIHKARDTRKMAAACEGEGRPKSDLDLDDVEFLLSLSLSMTKVAEILMVSRSAG